MAIRWFPTGVISQEKCLLSESRQQQISDEIRAAGKELDDPEKFIQDIEEAISKYKAFEGVKEQSRPAAVRRNLKSSLNAAMKLNDCINELDANSHELIRYGAEGGFAPLRDNLNEVVTRLSGALSDTKRYPNNFPDFMRTALANDVRKALIKQDIKPTTTKEGLYASILIIVLETATNKQVKAVHELMAKVFSMEEGDQ